MRKTEVYQIRLDSQEKKQAFAVFKQLGITPAQAVRLFFRQVVLTKSIPFSIENQSINVTQMMKLKHLQQLQKNHRLGSLSSSDINMQDLPLDDEHIDLFKELDELLGKTDKS